jgi:hypothetical protein
MDEVLLLSAFNKGIRKKVFSDTACWEFIATFCMYPRDLYKYVCLYPPPTFLFCDFCSTDQENIRGIWILSLFLLFVYVDKESASTIWDNEATKGRLLLTVEIRKGIKG